MGLYAREDGVQVPVGVGHNSVAEGSRFIETLISLIGETTDNVYFN